MMKKKYLAFSLLFAIGLTACSSSVKSKIVKINNPLAVKVDDKLVYINLEKLTQFNINKLSAYYNDKELPSQLVDINGDGRADEFAFLVNMKGNETKNIILKESDSKVKFADRVHAEVSEKRDYKMVNGVYTAGHFVSVKKTKTPHGHIDHNYYYKCEGPSWESDKVGYRLYLDWRNSTDIFGKKVSKMVLPNVGHTKDAEGHDRYHTMNDWGMDVFKVGNSLGIGTFGAWVNNKVEKVSKTDSTTCTILNDGPIFASLNIKYSGWNIGNDKFDLNSYLSIAAGSRLTHYMFKINSNHKKFCTGLAKHNNTEFFKSNNSSRWNYIALWGEQSLAGENDELGIAIFYRKDQFIKLTDDALSNIILLTPRDGKIDYYFAAAWEQEKNGIKNIVEFKTYLNKTLDELNNPLKIY